MSTGNKKLRHNTTIISLACSICRNFKFSKIFQRKPKSKANSEHNSIDLHSSSTPTTPKTTTATTTTTTTTTTLGCSICRHFKFSKIFQRKPKSKANSEHTSIDLRSSSTSTTPKTTTATTTTATTATTFSPNTSTPTNYYSSFNTEKTDVHLTANQGFARISGDSLAFEKESDNPYLDFRQSMLQMIREKEIYSKQDLRELLNCFLQLNSPYHYGIIIRAFTEIWNDIFSLNLHSHHMAPDF